MSNKKKKIGFKLILLSLLFIPGLQVLFIVGFNSNYLIRFPFFIAILVLTIDRITYTWILLVFKK